MITAPSRRFIVLFMILGVYWIMSFYLFGSAIDAFSTLGDAWNANFNLLLGSTDYNDAIMEVRQLGCDQPSTLCLTWMRPWRNTR
jgi:hypothetical protein